MKPQLIMMLAALSFARESGAQALYERPHDVLVEAIRNGEAHGVLRGHVAELFAKQFHSTGALLVDAAVIESLAQPDCKRVRMVYTQQGALTKHGERKSLVMETRLNYCLNGLAPGMTRGSAN
jgi:hypothetical protein